ncbi:MAG TPA: sensor histidine kinase [Micropepsaceae bacterium]|nr:sensor histidine kinase [Micropepsaceae bacterium]
MLCLVAGGFVLSGIFRGAVQENLDDRLSFDLDGLIAAAEVDAPEHVSLQGRFADPRFERVFSGWYWQIEPEVSQTPDTQPQTSRSLWDQFLAPQNLTPGGSNNALLGFAAGPDGQHLRVISRRIAMPRTAEGREDTQVFRFMVAGDEKEMEADVARFNRTLFWAFALFSLGLLAAIAIQVRVGLMPLRRVSSALARIREGRARRLEGTFPAEIAPLAGELNSLIAHSAEVVGRARAHVANLAHFLKTPLTVLANEAAASSSPLAETVTRQVTAMRRQVDHYLARARAAGALDVLGSRTEAAPVLNDLARVLKRMHPDKDLSIAVDVAPGIAFRGEREDFEEMAGNLIDNACKWAKARIAVQAGPLDGGRFYLRVGDDGHGLAPDERARAMERGERLDESVPGTGLGLAIVRDIAKLYGGNFTLGEAALGGLEARLELPRAA